MNVKKNVCVSVLQIFCQGIERKTIGNEFRWYVNHQSPAEIHLKFVEIHQNLSKFPLSSPNRRIFDEFLVK